ncbi:MAG: amidohydrolase family protein [bacterium]|nr:amidohydrolase family protein [bacterium]
MTSTADLLRLVRDRLNPGGPVIDAHVHPLDNFGGFHIDGVRGDVDRLCGAARRAGITRACLFSLHTTVPRDPTPAQCRQANDYALAMRDTSDGFFLPFCYVSPTTPDAAVAEIDRCVGGEGMVGIKLWVAQRATDPRLDPILRRSVDLAVPVLQHAWRKTTGNLPGESFPADVADLARRHPQARIIMAHLNGCNPRGVEDVRDCDNVYVDTSGGDPETGMVELAVERLGAHRVVYGSDAPIRHFGVTLAKVVGARLSDADKRAVLWNNLKGLLPERAGLGGVE